MKAAVFYRPKKIDVREVEDPKIEANEVLVKVYASGICGTDIHIYRGEWDVPTPLILGHEFSGVIEEVGENVANLKPGDKVVAEPNIVCGKCRFCLMHERNYFCENLQAVGVTRNGAFAELVSVPDVNIYRVPDSVSMDEAALIEPLACCVRGIDRAGVKAGDVVAIIGAGPIGLILLQLAKMSGASIVVQTDIVDYRLETAEKLGADYVVNASREDPARLVKAITGGVGVDVAIEAVGNPSAISQALSLVRRGGRLNIFGVSPKDAFWSVRPFELYEKEITITMSYRSPFTFQRAVNIAASKRINLKALITHSFALEEVEEAFRTADKKPDGTIKVLVKP